LLHPLRDVTAPNTNPDMIANARSLALTLVGLPAVIGFGTMGGGVNVGIETTGDFRPDLNYLNDGSHGEPCAELENKDSGINVIANGWCGQVSEADCGSVGGPLKNLLARKTKMTTNGESVMFDICAWDPDFVKPSGVKGKCRIAEWLYACPTTCPGVTDFVKERSDPTVELKNDCKTVITRSKLHFEERNPPVNDGGILHNYFPATSYPLDLCEQKLIEGGRRLEEDDTPPTRRRLNYGTCPAGSTTNNMDDGGICCDNSGVGGAPAQLLDEPFKETAEAGTQTNYLETCTFYGGSNCTCSYTPEVTPAQACPTIPALPW